MFRGDSLEAKTGSLTVEDTDPDVFDVPIL
jgi:hypothetical protein